MKETTTWPTWTLYVGFAFIIGFEIADRFF
jgi:hypothetical protein